MKKSKSNSGLIFICTALLLVVVLVLLNAVVGILGERYSLRADLTANGLFEIDEESKAFISGLQDEINIYVLATEDAWVGTSTYMAQANNVLKQYAICGDNLNVTYIDYVSNPTFAANYPDIAMSHGDILIENKSKNKLKYLKTADLFNYTQNAYGGQVIASSKADQVLCSAVMNVIANSSTQVSVIEGHGEYTMTDFVALLENNNYTVIFEKTATQGISENSDLAFLIAPHTDLSAEEIEGISNWLYNRGQYGKTLIYTADAEQEKLDNIENFIEEWGVQIGEGAVFETNSSRVYNYHPFYAVTDYVDEETAAMLRDTRTPMLMPISRPLFRTFDYRNNNQTKLLLQFGESAAVRPKDAPEGFSQADAEIRGPLDAMVVASFVLKDKSTGEVSAESRIIVSGSTGMLDGYAVNNTAFSNSDYILNLLGKCVGKAESFNIQNKTITGNALNISTGTANALGILLALVIPSAIIITGLAVWGIRRRR